jgi:hypothetical protein
MSTHEDLSSLPPVVLRAALNASKKRVKQEKEKTKREIQELQKKLDDLEKGEDPPGASQRKPKRLRVDSSSEDEVVEGTRRGRRSFGKMRRVNPVRTPSPLRYVGSRDGKFVLMGYTDHHAQDAKRGG